MVLAAVAGAMCGTTLMPAHGEPTAFPPSAITDQDKIDWLTAEAGRAAQAVDAEAEKPSAEHRETVVRQNSVHSQGVDQ
jgi:hypothetical protein